MCVRCGMLLASWLVSREVVHSISDVVDEHVVLRAAIVLVAQA